MEADLTVVESSLQEWEGPSQRSEITCIDTNGFEEVCAELQEDTTLTFNSCTGAVPFDPQLHCCFCGGGFWPPGQGIEPATEEISAERRSEELSAARKEGPDSGPSASLQQLPKERPVVSGQNATPPFWGTGTQRSPSRSSLQSMRDPEDFELFGDGEPYPWAEKPSEPECQQQCWKKGPGCTGRCAGSTAGVPHTTHRCSVCSRPPKNVSYNTATSSVPSGPGGRPPDCHFKNAQEECGDSRSLCPSCGHWLCGRHRSFDIVLQKWTCPKCKDTVTPVT